jgi:hypothetical protein
MGGEPSLLGHILKGQSPALPEPIVGLAELVMPAPPTDADANELLAPRFWALLEFMLTHKTPMQVLHVHPLTSRASIPLVRLMAARFGRPMIALDLRSVEDEKMDIPVAVTLREARLHCGVPVFLNPMSTGDEEPNQRRVLRVAQRWRRALALEQEVVIFASESKDASELSTTLEPLGINVSAFELEPIRLDQRQRLFDQALERAKTGDGTAGVPVDVAPDVSSEQLASTYRIGVGDIEAVVRNASTSARLRARIESGNGKRGTILAEDLFQAARERTRHDLGKFAKRVVSRYDWDDLVLPPDVIRIIRDFQIAAVNRARVFENWGYGRKNVRGRGLSALFSGPPGTGKSMSAEVIARTLNVDLYQIDISTVVSKWIGETERNLGQIFDATEGSDAILFFDEADALFGRRTDVKESKDRYSNMEVSYLLQRIESYDGIVILASNLRSHIDEAFLRRFSFGITFPQPNYEARLAIWRKIITAETPTLNLSLEKLATDYEMSGGQIKTVALNAAMLASGERSPLTMTHLQRSYDNEMGKMQKLVWLGTNPN